MFVKTEVRETGVYGKALFAAESIRKGTIVCSFTLGSDVTTEAEYVRAVAENRQPVTRTGTRYAGRYFTFGNGDRVRLGASGGGVIEVFRDVTRDARNVRFFGAGAGSSIFGIVTPTGHQADRATDIGTLVLNGAQSFLTDPPFRIRYTI